MSARARAASYLRISDDREGRELGVARQRKDTRAVAGREGLRVVGEYVDNDLSASTKARKARPEYQRLLVDARAGKLDVIIAYTQGRLTRAPREFEGLIDLAREHGIRFLYVRSPSFDLNTAQGREIARTMGARAAGEAEETAERVARAVGDRAERGEFHGGPRGYGLEADGKTVRKSEAKRIKRWAARVLTGGSLHGLAVELNAAGVPTVSGAPWRGEVIRKILLAPRIAGLRVHNGVEYPAANPAIVPPATWRALRALLESGRGHGAGTARRHLGTGLYLCERCAPRTLNSAYSARGDRLYKCLGCWRSWRAEPVDAWLCSLVEDVLDAEDARERLLPRQRAAVDVEALATEARSIRSNMVELAADYALAKGATRAALKSGMTAGEARLAEIEQALIAAGRVDPLAEVLADDPGAAWRRLRERGDLGRQQAIIRDLMTVTLAAPIRGRARWDAELFIRIDPRD